MILRWIPLGALALLLAGCGQEPSGPVTDSTSATGGTPGVTIMNADVDLTQLSRDLRKWIVRNQRPPKNFEEFAASAQAQIPPPPPGKKYAISKQMSVILVKR